MSSTSSKTAVAYEHPIARAENDTFVEEPKGFAAAVCRNGKQEVGGENAPRSLAVVGTGIFSAREGRQVEVAEILQNDP